VGDLLLAAGLTFFVFAALVRVPALVTSGPASGGVATYGGAAGRERVGAMRHPYARLATNGPFSAMWLGQVISSLGDRIHQVALVFLVTRATDSSPLALGLVFAAMTVPSLLVGPVAGAFVDRWDRKRVMVGSDLIRAALVVEIPAAAAIHVGLVMALVFGLAVVSSFFRPARVCAVPQVVADEDLLSANSAMWIADTVSDMVGYGLGGLFVAFLGSSLALAFWIDGASYLASADVVWNPMLPSDQYALPSVETKIYEGAAVGLAVLTSDLIGRTELVVGQGLGIAVAPTVEGHLGGVRRLMADRAAVAAMGARGRALVVERYSWEAFEGKFVDFYARLCSAGRRG